MRRSQAGHFEEIHKALDSLTFKSHPLCYVNPSRRTKAVTGFPCIVKLIENQVRHVADGVCK